MPAKGGAVRKKPVYLAVSRKDVQYPEEPGAHVQSWCLGHRKGRTGYKSTESVNYMSFSTLKSGDYSLFFYLFEQEARGEFSEKLTEDHRIYRIPRITAGLD